MTHLLASLTALLFGPLVLRFAADRRALVTAVDAYVLFAVGGLVLLHLLPEALHAGAPALVAVVVGLFVPAVAERGLHRHAHGHDHPHHGAPVVLALALAALAVHATTDGAALGAHAHEALALGVVLHRLPVGLLVWWVVRPRVGFTAAVAVLLLIAGATVLGYLVGHDLLEALPAGSLSVLQGFVAGSLLHVVLHETPHPAHPTHDGCHGPEAPEGPANGGWAGALGALAAVVTLWAVGHDEHAGHHGAEVFFVVAAAAAPALWIGLALVGLLGVLPRRPRAVRPGRFGPVGRGLRAALTRLDCACVGAPPRLEAAAPGYSLARVLAAPQLGLPALLVSLALLGPALTGLRVALALLTAGLAAAWLAPTQAEPLTEPGRAGGARAGFGRAFGSVADHVLPWVLVGAGAGALLAELPVRAAIEAVPVVAWAPLAALLAAPTYLCPVGATPLFAVLLALGLPPGAGLAALCAGAALRPTVLRAIAEAWGVKTAVATAAAVCLLAAGAGALLDGFGFTPPLLDLGGAPTRAAQLALGGLGLLALVSLWRQGPRAVVDHVLAGPPRVDRAPRHVH